MVNVEIDRRVLISIEKYKYKFPFARRALTLNIIYHVYPLTGKNTNRLNFYWYISPTVNKTITVKLISIFVFYWYLSPTVKRTTHVKLIPVFVFYWYPSPTVNVEIARRALISIEKSKYKFPFARRALTLNIIYHVYPLTGKK